MRARARDVSSFARIQFGEDPQVRQLARLVHVMDQMHRCIVHELWETRRRLIIAQEHLQLMHDMRLIRPDVL